MSTKLLRRVRPWKSFPSSTNSPDPIETLPSSKEEARYLMKSMREENLRKVKFEQAAEM